MHVVHLIGYLGKNPEHKSVTTTDRKYAVLSLATQRSWKGADEEWHSKTEWHRICAGTVHSSPLDNQWERCILPLDPQEECVYGGQAE